MVYLIMGFRIFIGNTQELLAFEVRVFFGVKSVENRYGILVSVGNFFALRI